VVELVVAGADLARQLGVGLDEGAYGGADLLDGLLAHLDEVGAEGVQLGVEETFHGGK
jgi:hypothetical protein